MSLRASRHGLIADNRTVSELSVVMPASAEVKDDHLWVGGVDLVDLAHTCGTALYVYDEQMIEDRLLAYKHGLESRLGDGRAHVAYAGKAFCCTAVDKIVAQTGCWLDTSSGGEVAIAQAAGFPMEHVIAHGNNKTPREIREAIQAGVGRFVVDTNTELERINEIAREEGVVQKILLRITPGVVADTHSYIQTGAEDSKFGFTINNNVAPKALFHALRLENLEVMGYHMHIGSQIFNISSFTEAINVMARFTKQMHEETGFLPRELDCGGGLGVAYTVRDIPTPIDDMCELLATSLVSSYEGLGLPVPVLYIEPGRSIVGNAGLTLYTVGSLKRIEGVRTFVNIDGGMTDNIRTCLYDADYEAAIINKADKPRTQIVTIAGKHCESGDAVVLDCSLQSAEPGDILATFTTGAYCESMSSNYNQQPRPGVVFVKNGSYRFVKRRETYEDLLRRDVSE